MNDFFDFDQNGKVDLGEQYAAYRIFEDCTKDSGGTFNSPSPVVRGRKLSGFDIFLIVLLVYEVLKLICSLLY
jgi:hypothetical protein